MLCYQTTNCLENENDLINEIESAVKDWHHSLHKICSIWNTLFDSRFHIFSPKSKNCAFTIIFKNKFSCKTFGPKILSCLLSYSSWHRMSHFWNFLVFWPLFGLKHWVWGTHLVSSNVTMPKLTFRWKFD